MAYIWRLRYSHPAAVLGILGLMLLSHLVRGEHAPGLGFHRGNLRACLGWLTPVLAFVALAMLGAAVLLHTLRPIPFDQAFLGWAAYLPWALAQQYALNGYFVNRFQAAAGRRGAEWLASVLFGIVHLPNWLLVAVTIPGGYYCARNYRKYHNLYVLAIAHATVGLLLYMVVPDWLSHHLVVGPGWYGH